MCLITLSKHISFNSYRKINFLVAGMRGSGKTYGTLILVAQLASESRTESKRLLGLGNCPCQLYFLDFKDSDTAKLAEILPGGRIATNKKDAIQLVTDYDHQMHQRLSFLKKQGFGATAEKLGMPMYYLIIDEWAATNAAFQQGTTKDDRDVRYQWNYLITDIAMLNRVAGFGLGIISQQISVINSGLNTSIQEEAGFKLHFGDANETSYKLTFGNDIEIPDIQLSTGEAFAWIEGITSSGYVIPFAMPYIEPDRLWSYLKQALVHQDNEKYLFMTTKGATL